MAHPFNQFIGWCNFLASNGTFYIPGVNRLSSNIRAMFGLRVGIFTRYICWGVVIPTSLVLLWLNTHIQSQGMYMDFTTAAGYPIPAYVPCKYRYEIVTRPLIHLKRKKVVFQISSSWSLAWCSFSCLFGFSGSYVIKREPTHALR